MIDTNAMFIGVGTGRGRPRNNLEEGPTYPIATPIPHNTVCVYFNFSTLKNKME